MHCCFHSSRCESHDYYFVHELQFSVPPPRPVFSTFLSRLMVSVSVDFDLDLFLDGDDCDYDYDDDVCGEGEELKLI